MSESRWVKIEGEQRRALFRKLALLSAAIGIAWLVLSYVFLRDSIPEWAILIGLVGLVEGAVVYFLFGVERPDKSINDVWVDANGEIFSYLVKYVDANGKNRGPRIDFKLHCPEHGTFYRHFKDKDDLIAAVIERSFERWLPNWEMPPGDDDRARFATLAANVAKAMLDSPDFIRLGLMLALERRPVEPRARAMYLDTRVRASHEIASTIRDFAPELEEAGVHHSALAAKASDHLPVWVEGGLTL